MRLERLDILRGVAIVMMVLFHLNYSLTSIFGLNFLNFSEIFWYIEGKIAALGFIIIAGISYFFAEKKYQGFINKKYFTYALILGIIAAGISTGTYIFLPSEFIVFGILHFFALSFLLLPYVTKLRGYTFILGILVIIYGTYMIPIVGVKYLFPAGYVYPGFTSADYYPLFPYFGVLLLGYSFAYFGDKYGWIHTLFYKKNPNTRFESLLILAGKNSLLIYLVHQPIIIAYIYILIYLVKVIYTL